MGIDEGLRRQIVVAALGGSAFVVGLVALGVAFDGGGGLPPTGGLGIVALLVAFVLLMGGLGVFLARQ
jgi:hypothetical protein